MHPAPSSPHPPPPRHNGVVIEPTDGADRSKSMGDDDPHSSESRSHSRSRTPSSKENPAANTPLPPTTAPPGGAQSYYRQHTFAGGEYIRLLFRPFGTSLYSHGPPTGNDRRWPLSFSRRSSHIRNSTASGDLAASTSLAWRWFTAPSPTYHSSRLPSSLL